MGGLVIDILIIATVPERSSVHGPEPCPDVTSGLWFMDILFVSCNLVIGYYLG